MGGARAVNEGAVVSMTRPMSTVSSFNKEKV